MSYTIFSKSAAFPVAIGGSKIVKTFPSGLVLVSQEYAVPRGQEAEYAAQFSVGQPLQVENPTNQILYISKEPEWVDSGDGFTRLTVSAHSKMPDQESIFQGYILGSFKLIHATFSEITNGVITDRRTVITEQQSLNETYIKTVVIENDSPPNLSQELESVPELKIYLPDGTLLQNKWPSYQIISPTMYTETWYTITKTLIGVDQTHFGKYSELVLKYQASGQVNRVDRNIAPPA